MRRAVLILGLLVCSQAHAQKDPVSRSWNQPVAPFRILGNIYYVGASDVTAYLIATPKGHIVIDGGFEETGPMIMSNIEKLGFEVASVRIILSSHAHYDHAGGLAAIKYATGATLMAGAGDVPLLTSGGHNDPQFGDTLLFPPVVPDQALHDGDRIALGGSILFAHLTPGHTPGCVTWTMTVRERGKAYNVVFVGSPSLPSQYRLVGNARYPNVIADYRHTYEVLKALSCDVFLTQHGSLFDLAGKSARLQKGEKPNPFIDPEGYGRFVSSTEETFEATVRQQTAAAELAADRAPVQAVPAASTSAPALAPVPVPVASPAPIAPPPVVKPGVVPRAVTPPPVKPPRAG